MIISGIALMGMVLVCGLFITLGLLYIKGWNVAIISFIFTVILASLVSTINI